MAPATIRPLPPLPFPKKVLSMIRKRVGVLSVGKIMGAIYVVLGDGS